MKISNKLTKIPYEKFLLGIALYNVAQFIEFVENWEDATGYKRKDAVCSQLGDTILISLSENFINNGQK